LSHIGRRGTPGGAGGCLLGDDRIVTFAILLAKLDPLAIGAAAATTAGPADEGSEFRTSQAAIPTGSATSAASETTITAYRRLAFARRSISRQAPAATPTSAPSHKKCTIVQPAIDHKSASASVSKSNMAIILRMNSVETCVRRCHR
jgi:hypothetical protein